MDQEKVFFHVTNRGVEKRLIFMDKKDLDRFSELLAYYQILNPNTRFSFRNRPEYQNKSASSPLVHIISYIMMPDHFHLILQQTTKGSISKFMSLVTNSYTKYFNARHKRSGSLFKGTFKAIEVPNAQLPLLSRYIHRDPLTQNLITNLSRYPFSSLPQYLDDVAGLCITTPILEAIPQKNYRTYVENQQDYEATLPQIASLLLKAK